MFQQQLNGGMDIQIVSLHDKVNDGSAFTVVLFEVAAGHTSVFASGDD